MSAQAKKIRPEKASVLAELTTRAQDTSYLFFADYTGLKSGMTMELRRRLRGARARMQVVPNRIFRRALGEGRAKTHDQTLSGPTAVVVGRGDAVETARTLNDFSKEFKVLKIKGGELDGRALSAADVVALASLPAKPVLQAQLLGTLVAPMRNLAGVLQQKVASLVYVLKAVADKKAPAGA